MLDVSELQSLSIQKIPRGQQWFSYFLQMSYALFRRTHIEIEGIENLPLDRPAFLAMNHTDRYNCWPFQYVLARRHKKYASTWVKAKYFKNPFVRFFLLQTNNIPIAPKGILISKSFSRHMKRPPNNAEYRQIKDYMSASDRSKLQLSDTIKQYFSDAPEQRIAEIETEFAGLSKEVVRLNQEAFDRGHHIIIFPQGTRSIRLSKGHNGLAQMSQRLKADIIPIGCSGSDRCYPGVSPWARGGKIHYRIGKPIRFNGPELTPHQIQEDFIPFSAEATRQYQDQFAQITNIVMEQLNSLVDAPYQFSTHRQSDGVQGMNRFI